MQQSADMESVAQVGTRCCFSNCIVWFVVLTVCTCEAFPELFQFDGGLLSPADPVRDRK